MFTRKILLLAFIVGFLFPSFWILSATNSKICGPCGGTAPNCETGLECVDGQCQEPGRITFCPYSSNTTTQQLIDKVTDWALIIALVVAPLMILLGGFYMLTSAGDTKRSSKGKQIIIWASIGLAIFLFAKAIVSILRYLIGF